MNSIYVDAGGIVRGGVMAGEIHCLFLATLE